VFKAAAIYNGATDSLRSSAPQPPPSGLVGFDARKANDFGIGTHVRGLLDAFRASDTALRFAVFGPEGCCPDDPRFAWFEDTTPGYSLSELWRLSRAARRAAVDLFHAPHYVVPFGLDCRRVVTIHDVNHLRAPDFLPHVVGTVYADRMIRRALRADRVIAVSHATAADLRAGFDVRDDRIEVIPNGVHERFFAAPARGPSAVETEPSAFLFVGNPKPHKNLDLIFEALRRQRRPSSLWIAGRPPTPELTARVERAGLTGRVRWLGFVDDAELPGLYRACLALVLVSRAEGFGLPVAEAMACGAPVVVSRLPALVEIAGDAGLTVDPDDADGLSAAFDRLAEDDALRKGLGTRGARRALEFRWNRAAEATLAVYRDVLERPAVANPPDLPAGAGFPRDVFSLGKPPKGAS
jgi:glycosyltransferase involved in cell wall biosynthesis